MMAQMRSIDATELLALAREVVTRGGHLDFQVRGSSMAPTLADGDRVRVGPPSLATGACLLAELDGKPLLHRLERLQGERALLVADGCRRRDWIPVDQLIAEVKVTVRHTPRRLRRSWRWMRRAFAAAALAGLWLLHPTPARAGCVVTPYIAVDGQSCDWTPAENPLSIPGGTAPKGGLDLTQTLLTDDYVASAGVGNLYGLMTFASGTTFDVNAQVGLFLDISGLGTVDSACNANAALTFTCTALPCSTSSNWTATYYTGLSGKACQSASSGTTLTQTGTGQQAAFAISGTTIEWGVSYAAINLPQNFLVTPFSTTDLNTNAKLDTSAQTAYSTSSVGPGAATLTRLAARAEASGGVTVGFLTHGERGNLGFALYRARGTDSPRQLSFQPGRVVALEDWAYRLRDPGGRPGDRYWVGDLDQHTGKLRLHGPAVAAREVTLAPQPTGSRLRLIGNAKVTLAPNPPLRASAARLGASAEGMYFASDAALTAAGINPARASALSRLGQPAPAVRHGAGTVFYAGPIQNAYDGEDAYVLGPGPASGGSARWLRPPPGARLSATVRSQLHLEQPLAYNWDAATDDPYVWAWASNLFAIDPVTFDAPAAAAAQGGAGTLTVHLLGGTSQAHHVAVGLNGVSLGEVRWSGFAAQDLTAAIPPGVLQGAHNTLTVGAIFDTGADFEFAMLASADLTYDRLPQVEAGEARFLLGPGACASIAGLGPGAAAWDVTDPVSAAPILGASAIGGTLGLCAPRGPRPHRYEVFDDRALRSPTARAFHPGSLTDRRNAADEVIIVAPRLAADLPPLIAARRAQGLKVVVATLPEVQDAFGYGEADRWPIQDFLHYARTSWTGAPRYVLLVGGANSDVRDVLGTGIPDLIPSGELVAGADGSRSASDSWFTVGDDGVTPLLAIGRIPADTSAQLQTALAKILRADAQGPATQQALMAADVRTFDDDADFSANSAVVSARLQALGIQTLQVSAGDAAPAAEIGADLALGVDLLHYVGHAGTSEWGGNEFLSSDQVLAFANARLPLLTSYDCLDGMFDNPTSVALGWAALDAPAGGAMAAFVPSTVLSPREGHAFDLLVTHALYAAPSGSRLGDALLSALQTAAQQPALRDYVRTYNLLGDPASLTPLR